MDKEKKLQTGRSRRFLKLGGLTAKVAGSYLGEQVRERFLTDERREKLLQATNLKNAVRVVETLGQLKGAVMKLGQHMSLMADILPPEITEVLTSLQSRAPAVPFSQMIPIFEEELGKPPEELFQRFDRQAHASASIGQVHRAVTKDGRDVVVKVQYPNVSEMVESDLNNLKSLAKTLQFMGMEADLSALAQEVRERLVEELDYRLEMDHLMLFRRLLSDCREVSIPEPIPELSTRRILTMTHLPGMNWDEICSESVSEQERNRFATCLFDLFLRQFFDHAVIHADPHPGNYALDAEGRVVIYDFGCIKEFPREFIENYRRLLTDAIFNRPEKIEEDLARLGMSYMGKSPLPPEFFRENLEAAMEPFRVPQPVAIHESRAHVAFQRIGPRYMRYYHKFTVPGHLVMLNRVIGGMYGNFRRLRARVDLRGALQPYLLDP